MKAPMPDRRDEEIARLRAEVAKLRAALDELAITRHAQLQARLQLEVRSGTQ